MTRNATAATFFIVGLCWFIIGVLSMYILAIVGGVCLMIAGAMVGNHYTPGGNP